jgi:4-hydroxy-tetrahydrodipicolinate synthase
MSDNERLADVHDYVIPLITPFTESGEVDLEAARHNVRHTLEIPGCGALYFGSVYQEFWTLTTTERLRLFDVVATEGGGQRPVVAGVSSTGVAEAIELAAGVTASGADFLMVWPPLWGPRNRESVRRFYHEFAEQTDKPMFIYSTALAELGYYLDPSAIHELAAEIPSICGVKVGGNLAAYLALVSGLGHRLAVGTPYEEYWAIARQAYPDRTPDFLLGASRPMYMQTRERPYLSTMLDLLREGRITEAFGQLERVRDLIALQTASFQRGVHPIALVKYACSLLGQRGPDVRAPTPALPESEANRVREILTRLELIAPVGQLV